MDVDAPLVADRQPAERAEAGQAALAPSSSGLAEPGAAVDAATCDSGLDVTTGQRPAAAAVITSLVGVQLAGLQAGSAQDCWIGGTAWTTASSVMRSCSVAAVRRPASGMPLAPVRTWRFELGSPRLVGFGAAGAPPNLPQPTPCRERRAEIRWRCVVPGGRGAQGGGGPGRRPAASHVAGASTLCRTRNPSPGAASPRECPIAARRGCRSGS